jgi:hypothetical protein
MACNREDGVAKQREVNNQDCLIIRSEPSWRGKVVGGEAVMSNEEPRKSAYI